MRITATLPETACPVCGLPGAFPMPGWYDTCSRCGWTDEPEGVQNPGVRSPANDMSFDEARATWPQRAAVAAAAGPLSVLSIEPTPFSPHSGDYLVDGVPLLARTGRRVAPGNTTFARWIHTSLARELVEMMLLERESFTPSGRIPLYLCVQDADPFCGALTADVTRVGDRIVWSRLGDERYDVGPGEHEGWSLEPARGPAGFAFDAAAYRATLLAALR